MLLARRDQQYVDRIMESEAGFVDDYNNYCGSWDKEWRKLDYPDGANFLKHVLTGISAYVSMEYGG